MRVNNETALKKEDELHLVSRRINSPTFIQGRACWQAQGKADETSLPALYLVTREPLSTGGDFQKAFILNNSQQRREMLCFEMGDRQMTDCRKDMVFHTGNDALCIVSRPFFVGFMPCRRNSLKAFFRWRSGFFQSCAVVLDWYSVPAVGGYRRAAGRRRKAKLADMRLTQCGILYGWSDIWDTRGVNRPDWQADTGPENRSV